MKGFETGLRDESLLINLSPVLRVNWISDEDLMRFVNEFEKNEKGRASARVQSLSSQEESTAVRKQNVKQEAPVDQVFAASDQNAALGAKIGESPGHLA